MKVVKFVTVGYSGGDAHEHFPTSQKGIAFLSIAEAIGLMFQFGTLLIALVALMVTLSKNNKK
ncbi:putative holin-like toxin [Enterococcus gilvus]|uniref:putative holin-like toxin n=1 Tax=Enterococcus gilvus TaxID=160453 RepID=UPI0028D042C2|nr:putative holin-like toxin [Enterococcus gilvus]